MKSYQFQDFDFSRQPRFFAPFRYYPDCISWSTILSSLLATTSVARWSGIFDHPAGITWMNISQPPARMSNALPVAANYRR